MPRNRSTPMEYEFIRTDFCDDNRIGQSVAGYLCRMEVPSAKDGSIHLATPAKRLPVIDERLVPTLSL